MSKNQSKDPEVAADETATVAPVVAMCSINIGDQTFTVPVHETQPSPTSYMKGGTKPRVRLDDGSYYPVVLTKRDRVTGKVFDYVVRGRSIEATILNEHGVSERRRVFKAIARKLERVRPPGEIVRPEERFEVVDEPFKVME